MENQSKYIMIERNKFAALVKAHRKCLQILSILTYAHTVKEVQLTFTLEEICELLQMTREEVEAQRQKGYIRFSVQNGITVYEITDILRLKNMLEMGKIPQDRRNGDNRSGEKRDRKCNGFINRLIGFNMRQLVHASLFSGFGAADLAAE